MVQAICPWRITPLFATVTVGTFATAKTVFIGIEVAAVDALFDLVRQRYKAVQLIIHSQCVMVVDGWRFGFGVDVKSEQRLFSMLFSEGVAECCRLQVFISLAQRPLGRRCFPVHDAGVLPVRHHAVKLSDQGGGLKPGTLTEKDSATLLTA